MRPLRILRTAAAVVAALALVIVCVAFWPANLGGRTTFVTTHGTSMAPRFHAGDLAVVQPASHFVVGDIAAYRSPTLGNAVVLHRIISVDGTHFTFKGDNNNFVDPDHPTAANIVGVLRVRVPHGGAIRSVLSRPVVLFPLLALTLGGLVWLPAGKRRKRAKKSSRSGPGMTVPRSHRPVPALPHHLGRVPAATITALVLATTAAVMAGAALWGMPRSVSVRAEQPFTQTATLDYSGVAPRGAAYPDGRIRTGDPVFTRMVRAVDIDYGYNFTTASSGDEPALASSSRVVATLSSTTGWHREIVLASRRVFRGDRWRDRARLDLGALHDMQRAFTAETGLTASQASLIVSWNLHVGGKAQGAPVTGDLAPRLEFQLTPVELLPTATSRTTGRPAGATVVQHGSIAIPAAHPSGLSFLRIHISGDLARLLSLVVIAALLAAGAAVIAADRRRSARGRVATILDRYRYLLVRADAIPRTGDRSKVRVNSIRDLVRLAKLHEELIVYAEESGCRRFALFTEGVVYLYELEPVGLGVALITSAVA